MNLKLRKAGPQDAEIVLGINLRSIFELCITAYGVGTLRQWVGTRTAGYFAKSIAHGQIHLAESDFGPVGFIDVVKGEVLAIYVLPRFERRGIGRFLLGEAIQRAAEGVQQVTVLASLNAVPFYERFGFRCVRTTKYYRNGIDLPLVHMAFQLPQGCENAIRITMKETNHPL